ncbi:MAG: type II toxin-antitoxin system prevent-host-death family antitoxin [Gemmatimonadota bacterium]|nr:type II toxin-antitoxin system prevent-host-death family antitoxin [Gemmatimonadota bacterium]
MKSVSVSVAKNTLSALIRKVAAGTPITITDRGTPVAQLVPPAAQVRGIPPRFIELAEQGVVKLPEREPRADWDDDLPAPPRLARGVSAVEALLDERRAGR